jgi:hypothetical protein
LAFIDALAFNRIIAGTDAHAKNYSVVVGAGGNQDQASALREREQQKGLSHPVVGTLVDEIILRARRCARMMEGALRAGNVGKAPR